MRKYHNRALLQNLHTPVTSRPPHLPRTPYQGKRALCNFALLRTAGGIFLCVLRNNFSVHPPFYSFTIVSTGEGGEAYSRGGGLEGRRIGVIVLMGGWRCDDECGSHGPATAAPLPVSRGREGSPEGDVVADSRPGGKAATMLESMDSTLILATAKGWTGRHRHGGGRGRQRDNIGGGGGGDSLGTCSARQGIRERSP